uniref:Uncharacterized protein n=1 Tax=Coccidioides posadasii RMSCC 3488 TaxID=454284 RepID=A0A0J6IDQ3_COCPO|nr:hypothetical protein CPAG_06180 [Coccidioides posadasii RMSCC 3488]
MPRIQTALERSQSHRPAPPLPPEHLPSATSVRFDALLLYDPRFRSSGNSFQILGFERRAHAVQSEISLVIFLCHGTKDFLSVPSYRTDFLRSALITRNYLRRYDRVTQIGYDQSLVLWDNRANSSFPWDYWPSMVIWERKDISHLGCKQSMLAHYREWRLGVLHAKVEKINRQYDDGLRYTYDTKILMQQHYTASKPPSSVTIWLGHDNAMTPPACAKTGI